MNFGSSLSTDGHDTDRASVCDEYINPQYATVNQTSGYEDTNCTGTNRSSDSVWENRFGSDEGPLFALALGYRLSDSSLRAELEYFYRDTGYDETSPVPSAIGVNQDKIAQEITTAVDRIDSMPRTTCSPTCTSTLPELDPSPCISAWAWGSASPT